VSRCARHSDSVSSHQELVRRVGERCRLHGTFTLRSGQVSDTYFDKYLFESDPQLLAEVAAQAAMLIPEDTEVLAGLELGGIPVATAISLATGLPAVFVRKQAKRYGTARLSEGAEVAGRRVLVVEDVVTSGGQVVISTGELRKLGAHVDHALCVIDRQEGGARALSAEGIQLRALLTRADLDAAV
jgi:orotate phosphoribosyltransferase